MLSMYYQAIVIILR